MNANEIKAIAKKYYETYKYVGIRTQEETFELGALAHKSSKWSNGIETSKTINGLSVTNIRSKAIVMHGDDKRSNPNRIGYYYGDHLAIVCGNCAKNGEDLGELVIADPVVVEIIG